MILAEFAQYRFLTANGGYEIRSGLSLRERDTSMLDEDFDGSHA
jgi:hypothetical protein